MLCYTKPEKEVLEMLALHGCEAGHILAGVTSEGFVSGCSFLPATDVQVKNLENEWQNVFPEYRLWNNNAVEPCKSCDYLKICKGGCHAVSSAVLGSMDLPDPDCPFVVDYNKTIGEVNES